MTSGPNQHDSSVAAIDFASRPAAMVGRQIRRSTQTTPRHTPWAHVVMTVPSRDGVCWLVAFIDGDVDVWRVDDPAARYEFAT